MGWQVKGVGGGGDGLRSIFDYIVWRVVVFFFFFLAPFTLQEAPKDGWSILAVFLTF